MSFEQFGSIVEGVFAHADAAPDRLCLADRTCALTYGEVRERVAACAQAVVACEVGSGGNVVIECDQGVGFVIAVLAAQLAGCRSVPLEKGAPVARRVEIAREVEAAAYVGRELPAELAGMAFLELGAFGVDNGDVARCPSFPEGGQRATSPLSPGALSFPAGDSDAEILFSTGTTGKPKGVVMTHRANLALAENIIRGVKMGADNVEIVPMPLSHSHGLRTVYANLANGSSVVIADGVVALKQMLNLMDGYGVTALDLSPSMLSIIFKLSGDRLGEYAGLLDYVQLGSAPLGEQDKERLARLLPGSRLYNFYGSTEAGRSCVLEFGVLVGAAAAGSAGCIGRPAVNARFTFVDENRELVEATAEAPGLLASAGPGNMRCYFGEPELTCEVMADGFVYTNDLGYVGADGLVYLLGRADDVINFGGVKVAPEEVEGAALRSGLVKDCACVAAPDEVSGQVPVLFVVADEFDETELRRELAASLDAGRMPSRFVVVDAISRTPNGKILRRKLREALE